ncbi:MAG: hypothetical protein Q8R24_08175 [Legionellaceae bacterium]|nr:hypothetical protein [Legionellaceae bacterium]
MPTNEVRAWWARRCTPLLTLLRASVNESMVLTSYLIFSYDNSKPIKMVYI